MQASVTQVPFIPINLNVIRPISFNDRTLNQDGILCVVHKINGVLCVYNLMFYGGCIQLLCKIWNNINVMLIMINISKQASVHLMWRFADGISLCDNYIVTKFPHAKKDQEYEAHLFKVRLSFVRTVIKWSRRSSQAKWFCFIIPTLLNIGMDIIAFTQGIFFGNCFGIWWFMR